MHNFVTCLKEGKHGGDQQQQQQRPVLQSLPAIQEHQVSVLGLDLEIGFGYFGSATTTATTPCISVPASHSKHQVSVLGLDVGLK